MRKDSLAREMAVEMVVGAFMVLIFLGLACFTIVLSRESWFRKKAIMEVVFNNVMGLREGDNVVVRGMPIGKVSQLSLQEDGVRVTASLDQPVALRQDYRVTIVSTTVLGGHYLNIDAGSPEAPLLGPDQTCRGEDPYDLMADAAQVVNSVKQGLIEGGVIDALTNTVAKIQMIVTRVEAGEGTLGKLLSKDDQVYQDLASTVAKAQTIVTRVEAGEGTLGKLLSKDDQVYQDLASTVASLKTMTDRVSRGEGVMGRLISDDQLAGELDSVVREVRGAVDDFRETSPVSTFTSIFFGAF